MSPPCRCCLVCRQCPMQPASVPLWLQGVALGGVPSLHRSGSAARSVVSHGLGGLPQWHVLRGLPRSKKGSVPSVLLWWTGVWLKGKEGCRQPAWPRHSPIMPSGVPSPPPKLTIYCCVVRSLPRYVVARSKSGRMEGRLLPMPPFVAPSQLRCSLARALGTVLAAARSAVPVCCSQPLCCVVASGCQT